MQRQCSKGSPHELSQPGVVQMPCIYRGVKHGVKHGRFEMRRGSILTGPRFFPLSLNDSEPDMLELECVGRSVAGDCNLRASIPTNSTEPLVRLHAEEESRPVGVDDNPVIKHLVL